MCTAINKLKLYKYNPYQQLKFYAFIVLFTGCVNINNNYVPSAPGNDFVITDTGKRVIKWKIPHTENYISDTLKFPLPNLNNSYVEWTNATFIALRSSCGSACWHSYLFPLKDNVEAKRYLYSLAFDTSKKLIAYIPDSLEHKFMMGIANYETGKGFKVMRQGCLSDLAFICIDTIFFKKDSMVIKWDSANQSLTEKDLSIKIPNSLLE